MSDYTDDEIGVLAQAGHARAELRQTEAAFDAVRTGLFQIIESSAIGAQDVREQAYAGLHILKRVKMALEASVAAGDVAEGNAMVLAILKGDGSGAA